MVQVPDAQTGVGLFDTANEAVGEIKINELMMKSAEMTMHKEFFNFGLSIGL